MKVTQAHDPFPTLLIFTLQGHVERLIVPVFKEIEKNAQIKDCNVPFVVKISNEGQIKGSNVPFVVKIPNEGHVKCFIIP